MQRRHFLQTLSAAAMAPIATPPRPNILFVLADDLGYGDLGCYGQTRIQTPNIDRLAAEGIRFGSAYAGSTVCAPSRCSLMTGLHTGHAHTRGNKGNDLPLRPSDVTVTELLKKAGYRTGLFGKWSLGQLGTTGYPTKKGFDEWFGFFSQLHAHNYYPEHLLDQEGSFLLRGNMGTQHKDYAPDLFTKHAVSFLERQSATQPFFLHVCYTQPHANNEMGRDTGNGMQVPSDAPYTDRNWPQVEKNFAAMISRMDSDVGQLMSTLKRKGMDQNTLVLFASDNGPHKEGGHAPSFFESSGPLRGIKRDLTEGGIRVPCVARWPGGIKGGQVSEFPWAFWDILPTFAELAGVEAPKGLDGTSIVPTLTGRTQKPHEYFYWEFHELGFHQAVRMGNWKGIRKGPELPIELYDLATDLSEHHDLSAANPAVLAKIKQIMASARTDSPDFPILTPEEAKKRALPM
ncbi:arylsulfatase [Paludibaculum fermentans]|uniref:Arylsulfatase n=1 Tax=Paludibaculum fermentans TaxID=1473598 RepID=A0A7S7SLD1_PALFE|nr:arylsulfatase [Paludibaculum fermentans]QOY88703.1 arylsulfatase [Paludibaculum fermentans]